MTVEIRRRRGLVAAIAVLASGFAAGDLWRFAAVGGGVLLSLGVVLAAAAVWYAGGWWRARTPLLVADATGLRVRLGSEWTGVPWEDVDRAELAPAGRVTDGRLVVLPADASAAQAGASRRSRLAAAWNRKLYGAALAVPYGLATRVSVDDLPTALRSLADGRAEVVVLDKAVPSRARTAAVGSAAAAAESGDAVATGPGGSLSAADGGATPAAAPAAAVSAQAARPVILNPLRPLPNLGAATARASFGAGQPARREEVMITMRRESVDGALALSAPSDDVLTEELPEIAELRRRRDTSDPAEPTESAEPTAPAEPTDPIDRADLAGRIDRPESGGNISLIIDATTALSARAMGKVRRPPPEDVETISAESVPASGDEERSRSLYVGAELRRARENLRLTVDDLADRTRIRPYVIECMEADDFSPCGGDFYARGHLRMLSRVLGIASEPLIQTYDDHFATSPVNLRDVFDVELATGAAGMVRGGAAGASWGGLIAAVLILLVIWGVARFFADDTGTAPAPPPPSTSTSNSSRSGIPSAPGLALAHEWSVARSALDA